MTGLQQLEIPGHVTLAEGEGGLTKILIETAASRAEIYLHGAHVTHYQKNGGEPLLFMSAASAFEADKPIRGGIPVIFPWFGPREGLPAHGYARTVEWDLAGTSLLPDGSVSLRFKLPRLADFEVEYRVTVGAELILELAVLNHGSRESTFETCLHTYFQISGIDAISITGLSKCGFLNKLTDANLVETTPELRIGSEVDRVYYDTDATVEIHDPGYHRKIRIAKSGSLSTIVWNPWIDKSIRMPDFGDEEYLQMVCVESGNVGINKVSLPPGGHAVMKVVLGSEKLLS
jgi:D-hexose-6-phosphate mutarotase